MNEDLDKLEEEYKATTQGEWRLSEPWANLCTILTDAEEVMATSSGTCPDSEANHKWLCAAHNAFPALLSELRELRELKAEVQRLEAIQDKITKLENSYDQSRMFKQKEATSDGTH